MEGVVSGKIAAQRLGVNQTTVRRGEEQGKMDTITTPGGHRRYRVESVESLKEKKQEQKRENEAKKSGVLYCRVSSRKQENAGDLQRQIEFMHSR